MNYPWTVYLTCFIALPSWLLTCALTPLLPKGHAWYRRYFSLPEWYMGRTEFTCDFDSVMWGCALIIGFVLFR